MKAVKTDNKKNPFILIIIISIGPLVYRKVFKDEYYPSGVFYLDRTGNIGTEIETVASIWRENIYGLLTNLVSSQDCWILAKFFFVCVFFLLTETVKMQPS